MRRCSVISGRHLAGTIPRFGTERRKIAWRGPSGGGPTGRRRSISRETPFSSRFINLGAHPMIGSRYRKHDVLGFEERIDPASTALVIIDVQNDFALPQGVCGLVGDDISPVAPMIDRLKVLIAAARRANLLIIFMRTIYDDVVLSPTLAEQYARRGYPNSICLTGSHGAEFVEGIDPREAPNEIVLTKHRYSAFWGSAIDLFLRKNGIRSLVLAGFANEY